MSAQAPPARPMGPRRALPTPPLRANERYQAVNAPPEMIAALGPPPSATELHPPLPHAFLNPPSTTPIPSPMPSPGLLPVTFHAPPPPPPLPLPTAPLNIQRARPRVEVPRYNIPSDIDSADADDERIVHRPRASFGSTLAVLDERSPLPPAEPDLPIPIEAAPSPGPMIGRIGGTATGRPKLGLRTASNSSVGSALPDDDAPAPPPDLGASLPQLRPKLQLSVGPTRPKLGLSLSQPAPALKLDLSAMRATDSEDDDADYSYYGFKPSSKRQTLQLNVGEFPSDATTMQPPSTTTAKPAHHTGPGRAGDGLDEVRRAINDLRMPELEEELEQMMAPGTRTPHSEPEPRQDWSDDMLEVLAHLGEGAGGAVSKVRDKRTGRLMARKTIPTGTVPARQLLRELQFSKLVHPNLIVCYGAYISSPPEDDRASKEGTPPEIHILMELCEGGALDSIARQMKTHHANRRIGEKVIARLAEGVLKGLDYMHSNKVTHRDIKPSNILVTRQGVVKLIDFGVSGELEMSLASTFTGTSWYMAPERITGHPYSIRADVWSTGLSFLELAQNRFPYPPDLGPIELLTYIVNGEVPELDDEPGDEHGNGAIHWSDGMKSFIKQCLRLDAATRPTPREMLQHPWIQESIARKLDMAKWIREVWGWEKQPKPKRQSQD